jgi:serine/threonine-protein kinase
VPDFGTLSSTIDERLNRILQKALERDLDKRYPNADEFLYDLEHYIYAAGYGPTNETLGRFMRELFDNVPAGRLPAQPRGETTIILRPKPA